MMPRWTRLLTIALVAMALALRAWVPTGWMPAPGAHSLEIMPCPAAAPAHMDMRHGPAGRDHAPFTGDCFSPLLAGAALPDAPPVVTAPPAVRAPAAPRLAPVAVTRGPAALPPPSTGPPPLA